VAAFGRSLRDFTVLFARERAGRAEQAGEDLREMAGVQHDQAHAAEDMPAHAEGASDDGPPLDGPHSEMAVSPSTTDVLQTGEQWKRSIAQQKSAVADLKNRIDKLNASKGTQEYRVGEIYLSSTPATDAQTLDTANKILAQLRNLSFGTAAAYSVLLIVLVLLISVAARLLGGRAERVETIPTA